jgi:hypothetical protein
LEKNKDKRGGPGKKKEKKAGKTNYEKNRVSERNFLN